MTPAPVQGEREAKSGMVTTKEHPGAPDAGPRDPHGASEPGLRERKAARTRAELKAVADRLFDRRGFDQVTVEDICAEVELSPRTFFRYFHNKDEIVFTGVQAQYDRVLAELARRPPEEPAPEALRETILEMLSDPSYGREAKRIHRQILGSPELMRASLATFRRFRDQLVAAVVQRPPFAGDERRARLLVGIIVVALEAAIDEWAEDPVPPLRSELTTVFEEVAEVAAGLQGSTKARRSR